MVDYGSNTCPGDAVLRPICGSNPSFFTRYIWLVGRKVISGLVMRCLPSPMSTGPQDAEVYLAV